RSASRRAVSILDEHVALPRAAGDAVHLNASESAGPTNIAALVPSQSGAIRVVAADAIFDFSAGRFSPVRDARFQSTPLGAATEDREGNLWMGTQAGRLRVARRGFTTFRDADGLGRAVARVLISHAGEPVAVSEGWRISRFDGESFQTVRANVPEPVRRLGGPAEQSAIQDRAGDWWIATRGGLFRFPHPDRFEDLATMTPRWYTSRDGLAQDDVRMVFEDASGGIWIAALIPGREVLTRWDRATGRFQRYSDADGLQAFNAPTSFHEDSRGVLWITFRDGGMARYEAGRFRMLT